MAFTKFTIKNFKCYRDEQTFMFATPNNQHEGSGITYVVGANNSGKTTIIETLSIKDKHKIKSSERICDSDPEFALYDGEAIERKCSS